MSAADIITATRCGKTFRASRRTFAHLDYTIAELKRSHPTARLRIIQPCFNTGVPQSKGTHDKDACFDVEIVGLDWWAAQRFLRRCGWAAWFRFPPTFSRHIHMISLGWPGGSARVGAFVPGQVDDYYRHALGLKGQHNSGVDRSWFPPNIATTVFDYAAWVDRDRPKPQPAGWGEFLHAPVDRTWECDSVRGVQAAAKRGPIGSPKRAIDINTTGLSADGLWVANHYPKLLQHGFRDPKGKVSKTASASTLPLATLRRLEAGPARNPYHVERLVEVLAEALRLSVRVELEIKTKVALAAWKQLAAHPVVKALLKRDLLVVKSLASMPGAAGRLKPAKAAGFPTMLSFTGYEGDPLPEATYGAFTTYYRGTPRWA